MDDAACIGEEGGVLSETIETPEDSGKTAEINASGTIPGKGGEGRGSIFEKSRLKLTDKVGARGLDDSEFFCGGKGHAELDALEDFALISVVDVHVFDADDLFVGKETTVLFREKDGRF